MKNILVIGAGGYIGSSLAEYLYCEGFSVTGTYRNRKPDASYSLVRCDLAESVEIDGDFDVIVHAAGEKPVRRSELSVYERQDFGSFTRNNIDAMRNIITFARTHRTKRIIYLSTIGVHGEIRTPVLNEDTDIINPDSYGLTKLAAEMLLKSSCLSGRQASDIDSISLRLPGVIGKGAEGIWFTNVLQKMKDNEDITIYAPDFVTKNFVWIEDLCRFTAKLIDEGSEYDTLTLGCREGITIKDMISAMMKETSSSSRINVDDSARSPFCIDASRAFSAGYISLSPEDIVKEYMKIEG